jgi:hypothetical protein
VALASDLVLQAGSGTMDVQAATDRPAQRSQDNPIGHPAAIIDR